VAAHRQAGRNIEAIRTLVRVASLRDRKRVFVDLANPSMIITSLVRGLRAETGANDPRRPGGRAYGLKVLFKVLPLTDFDDRFAAGRDCASNRQRLALGLGTARTGLGSVVEICQG